MVLVILSYLLGVFKNYKLHHKVVKVRSDNSIKNWLPRLLSSHTQSEGNQIEYLGSGGERR